MNTAYHHTSDKPGEIKFSSGKRVLFTFILLLTAMLTPANAGDRGQLAQHCTRTAQAVLRGCQHEVEDNYWIALASCYNISDPSAREKCLADAEDAKEEATLLCNQQFNARLSLCEDLGEGPFDPQIDPAMFVDPHDIGTTVDPNPYFPLLMGRVWTYESENEVNVVTVTEETKEILGVTTVVVRDVVELDGLLHEDTRDWYGQDIYGNVWYFGELVLNYEEGELVNIDGSWISGVDGGKPGIIMETAPQVEDVYRQEFSPGNVEDAGEVLSLTASEVVPAASCNGDCLVTEDFTPIEPGSITHKYYKPGIGLMLEVYPATGERVELVEVTDDGVTLAEFGKKSSATTQAEIELNQNNPNPFNPTTSISYSLSAGAPVLLKVHNILGEEVVTLVDGFQTAGVHNTVWDGRNVGGSSVSSGVYVYTLRVGSVTKSRRMIYLK
jgi:hypothetical protein